MSNKLPHPQNLAELEKELRQMRRAVAFAANELSSIGSDAAEMISHAYNYVGLDDAGANAKGGRVLQDFEGIRTRLEGINENVRDLTMRVKAAQDAVQEADVKRRSERAKLGA